MKEQLAQSILSTLAYFDIFSHPLTAEELYRFLWKGKRDLSYELFLEELERLVSEEYWLKQHGAYYTLAGAKDYLEVRAERTWYVEHRLKIARRAANIFKWLPYVKAMFVCNQIEAGVSKGSDIDVFIVVEPKRLWLTRLLITLVASGCGLRRSGEHVANHICLSFYATDDVLDFSPIRIEEPDVYMAYWIDQLIPVYDPQGLHAKMQQENIWQRELLPHRQEQKRPVSRWRADDGKIGRRIRSFFEKAWTGAYGDLLENQAKNVQRQKMKLNRESKQGSGGTDVIISDQMLKFHENDRRGMFQEEWRKKIAQYAK